MNFALQLLQQQPPPPDSGTWGAFLGFVFSLLLNLGFFGSILLWAFGRKFLLEMKEEVWADGRIRVTGLFGVATKLIGEGFDLILTVSTLVYVYVFGSRLWTVIGTFFRAVGGLLKGIPIVGGLFTGLESTGFPDTATLAVIVPALILGVVWFVYKNFWYLPRTKQTWWDDLARDIPRIVIFSLLILLAARSITPFTLLDSLVDFYKARGAPYL